MHSIHNDSIFQEDLPFVRELVCEARVGGGLLSLQEALSLQDNCWGSTNCSNEFVSRLLLLQQVFENWGISESLSPRHTACKVLASKPCCNCTHPLSDPRVSEISVTICCVGDATLCEAIIHVVFVAVLETGHCLTWQGYQIKLLAFYISDKLVCNQLDLPRHLHLCIVQMGSFMYTRMA